VLWRLAVLAAWFGVLYAVVSIEPDDETPYVVVGIPLTVAVGVLVNRWWALLAPWLITVVLTAITYASWPGCNGDCADGDERGLVVIALLIIFAIPATLLFGAGVGSRRFARFMRRLDKTAEQDA